MKSYESFFTDSLNSAVRSYTRGMSLLRNLRMMLLFTQRNMKKLDYWVVLAPWMRLTYSLKKLRIGFVRVTSDSRAVTLVVFTTSQ